MGGAVWDSCSPPQSGFGLIFDLELLSDGIAFQVTSFHPSINKAQPVVWGFVWILGEVFFPLFLARLNCVEVGR